MKKLNRNMLACICVGVMSLVLASCSSESSDAITKAQTFDGKLVEEVMVKTDGENIVLRPSRNEEVRVRASADHKIQADLNGNILTVQPSGSSGIVNLKTVTLYVEVPAKSFRKLTLRTLAGQISGENVKANELYLSADSGKIIINGFEGDKLGGDMISGNVDLQKVDGALSIKNDSGDVNIANSGMMEKDGSIKTNSGNVVVKFDSKPTALQLDVSSQSGKIESSLTASTDVTSKSDEKILNKKIGSNEGVVPTLTIRTSSGNVTLK